MANLLSGENVFRAELLPDIILTVRAIDTVFLKAIQHLSNFAILSVPQLSAD